jgi:hypothetical protein
MLDLKRSSYGEILNAPEFVNVLLRDAEKAGCWETGIASDKKHRGTSINTAVYGFDEEQELAIVQVRECQFRPGRYSKVRKDYYLLGRVENGSIFAHAIDSPIRSKLAMSDPQYCVDYALSKIWNCKIDDLQDIIRQGDVALIPIVHLPDSVEFLNGEAQVIRDTHKITGDIWRDRNGTLYCKRGAKIVHTKHEHKTIKARSGFYRVQPGYRAEVWGFSAPTTD